MADQRQQHQELNKLMGFKVPLDGVLLAKFQMLFIDILAFDQQLHYTRHQYLLDESMNDHVLRCYGQRAFELFTELSS